MLSFPKKIVLLVPTSSSSSWAVVVLDEFIVIETIDSTTPVGRPARG